MGVCIQSFLRAAYLPSASVVPFSGARFLFVIPLGVG